MVYGSQVYQPRTNNAASVAAYYFRGDRTEVITIVNTDNSVDHDVHLEMRASESDSM
jgi:hypothetical protein